MEAIQVLIPPSKATCPFQSEKDVWIEAGEDDDLLIKIVTINSTDKSYYDIAWIYRYENETEFITAFNDNIILPASGEFDITPLEEGTYFCRKGILYQVHQSRNNGLSIMIATVFYSSELVELIAQYKGYSDLSSFLVKMYAIHEKEEVFSHIAWCIIGTGPDGPVKFFYPAFAGDLPEASSRSVTEYNWKTLEKENYFVREKLIYQIKQEDNVLYFEQSHLGIIKF